MATISDERLAEMSSQLGSHIAGADWWPDNFECKPDELYSILTELQSLRSQAGVSEAVAERLAEILDEDAPNKWVWKTHASQDEWLREKILPLLRDVRATLQGETK